MLTGAGLRLAFGLTQALDSVDLSVDRGEVVAVMGPSGAGKSTLLHVMSGVLVPDEGSVAIGGYTLDQRSDDARSAIRLRRFGFVFQFGDLIPELSLQENVELPLRLQGRGRDARDAATRLLVELEIADVAGRRPGQVSGGQAQRAAVARALVHDPEFVFADEPTGALDSAAGELVLDALTGTARRRGTGVLLVTHEARAAAYADRTVFLHDGRLATDDRLGAPS
ncbi:ABC transporter ATP-binding protein [Dactylosporangium sp. NBC_01737]|uniref:ABC transporter ATP-binding protein n=1 Tax=Dactylosporangium sp. NBC_01737 TaxID=2975959 RepID=UPI002E0F8828|nr:ABC transporter ATP-binding protein [Dactylosporangium sp. NBC_01737]